MAVVLLIMYMFSILFHVYVANDVESITMLLADDPYAPGLDGVATITLWFNFMVYQFELDATHASDRGQSFTFYKNTSPFFTVLGSSNCGETQNAEAKMMIDNDYTNGIIFDKVSFSTSSSTWFGINKVCADQTTEWDYQTKYSPVCDDQHIYHIHYICVDNEANCRPPKQMIHFNLSKHNEFIDDALWTDATNVEIITCAPTTTAPTTDEPTTNIPTTDKPTTNEPTTNEPTTDKPTTHQPTTDKPTTDKPRMDITSTNIAVLSTTHLTLSSITVNSSVASVASTSVELYHTNTDNRNTIMTNGTQSDDSMGGDTYEYIVIYILLLLVFFFCAFCLCVFCIYPFVKKKRDCERDVMVMNVPKEGNPRTHRVELANSTNIIKTPTDTKHSPPNVLMIDYWLKNVVKLPLYYDVFMRNGYKSMQSVVKIQAVSDLENIGIKNTKHRERIMAEIEKLQEAGNTEVTNMNKKIGESSISISSPLECVSHEGDHQWVQTIIEDVNVNPSNDEIVESDSFRDRTSGKTANYLETWSFP